MYGAIRSNSKNNPKLRDSFTTTPETDGKKIMSEIDVCYNIEYDNWFIKTFWGSKKAYRYKIRLKDRPEWDEFIECLFEMNEDILFK